jgi:hypothetical protein
LVGIVSNATKLGGLSQIINLSLIIQLYVSYTVNILARPALSYIG